MRSKKKIRGRQSRPEPPPRRGKAAANLGKAGPDPTKKGAEICTASTLALWVAIERSLRAQLAAGPPNTAVLVSWKLARARMSLDEAPTASSNAPASATQACCRSSQ